MTKVEVVRPVSERRRWSYLASAVGEFGLLAGIVWYVLRDVSGHFDELSWRGTLIVAVVLGLPFATWVLGYAWVKGRDASVLQGLEDPGNAAGNGLGYSKEAGGLLFGTIGLLLVDFQYLALLYGRRDTIIDEHPEGQIRTYMLEELTALSVGGVAIFCCIILVFFWMEPTEVSSDLGREAQRPAFRALVVFLRCIVFLVMLLHLPSIVSSTLEIEQIVRAHGGGPPPIAQPIRGAGESGEHKVANGQVNPTGR